ncbi:hypothetical protein D8S78_05350 [Natrialba swarupiae]|nr:hypothetical protein [Natrialba swarupiae]
MTDNRDSESSEAHGTESDSGADDGRAPEKRQAASSLSVILAVSARSAVASTIDTRRPVERRRWHTSRSRSCSRFRAMVWCVPIRYLGRGRWHGRVVDAHTVVRAGRHRSLRPAGANEAGKRLLGSKRELLLTTVRDRDLVLGLLLADLRESGGILGPTAVLVLVFGVGVGSPTLVAVATVAAVLVTLAATLVGYVVGLGARLGLRHIPLSSSAQSALSGVASVGVFCCSSPVVRSRDKRARRSTSVRPRLRSSHPRPPPLAIGYYADFFVGTPMLEGIGYLALASGRSSSRRSPPFGERSRSRPACGGSNPTAIRRIRPPRRPVTSDKPERTSGTVESGRGSRFPRATSPTALFIGRFGRRTGRFTSSTTSSVPDTSSSRWVSRIRPSWRPRSARRWSCLASGSRVALSA